MSSRLTLEEQEKILMVAEGLIREPETWTEGAWKCPVYEKGRGNRQAKDANGRLLYAYCIEGAVNQATYDVLGEERALKLGAVNIRSGTLFFDGFGDEENTSPPTRMMGLNKIAEKLYGDIAMNVNDADDDDFSDEGNLVSPAHEHVLTILRTRLKEVRAAIKRKS